MHCKVINNSGMDLGDLEQHIQGMYKHFDDQIGFSRPPTLFLDSDPSNAPNTLGKTAYYDPQTFEIHVYTDGRHPKDMLRSIAHELIHHQQNLEGRLDVGGYHGEGYYLQNEALKELEQEAMLEGNHYLREYEDTLKTQEKQMSLKEWKNKELFENLMGKWGVKTNILNEKKEFPDLTGDGKVTQADILKGRGVELDEGEHKCPECEGKGKECKCPKNEQLDEALGVLAITGLAAAVVAGIGAMAGIDQDQTEKLEAFLAEDEQAGITQKLALLDFMGDKKEHARLTRAILNSDRFRQYGKVDEVSVAAGVQGAPMPAKEDLQESINSILKKNKEMIKRLLK